LKCLDVSSNDKVHQILRTALDEDLRQFGDVTSTFVLNDVQAGTALIQAKAAGIIAGLTISQLVFKEVDATLTVEGLVEEGSPVKHSDLVAKICGPVKSILTAERTALNFLQRLSGIATLTSRFVAEASDTKARILDTRKTTPGLRVLEKYAVRVGGGQNHRMGLYDMVLIKDNHIAAAGGITAAVNRCRSAMHAQELRLAIEVETITLEQVAEARDLRVDRIMLDNMTLQQITAAVELVDGQTELEVSGGITLDAVADIARTGIDFISVGALTHSAVALDLSLIIE
jgi:nicotinate-nucleotide pyrophosphorylase (carboxylating)